MTTLFIIGNGFDLKHKLKTSYNDFQTFLETKDQDFYIKFNEELFNLSKHCDEDKKIENLWSRLEENVGTNNRFYEKMIDYIVKEAEYNQKETSRNNPVGRNQTEVYNNDESLEIEKRAFMNDKARELFENNFEQTNKEFLEYLKKFIKSVNEKLLKKEIKKDKTIETILEDNPDAKFVTFNYTNILESIYRIEHSKILYVHGKEENDGKLIFGNRSDNINDVTDKFSKIINESDEDVIVQHDLQTHPDINRIDVSEEFIDRYNEIQKEWIKKANLGEFNRFVDDDKINKIIILGHSMGVVDEDYFTMLNELHPNKEWIIYLRSPKRDNGNQLTKDNFNKLFHNSEVNHKFYYYDD